MSVWETLTSPKGFGCVRCVRLWGFAPSAASERRPRPVRRRRGPSAVDTPPASTRAAARPARPRLCSAATRPPPAKRTASPESGNRLEQVNSSRQRHRERHRGIPVIALEDEDQDDDEAYQDRSQPGDPTEVHGRILIEVHGVIVAVIADGWLCRFGRALEAVCGRRRITQIPEIQARVVVLGVMATGENGRVSPATARYRRPPPVLTSGIPTTSKEGASDQTGICGPGG
jgi:hypothetical protein